MIGVSRKQCLKGIFTHLNRLHAKRHNGLPRYIGQSHDKLILVEIIGRKADVSYAAMALGMAISSDKIIQRNLTALGVFIQNIMPEWSGALPWILENARQAMAAPNQTLRTVQGVKAVKMCYQPDTGHLITTITHHEDTHYGHLGPESDSPAV